MMTRKHVFLQNASTVFTDTIVIRLVKTATLLLLGVCNQTGIVSVDVKVIIGWLLNVTVIYSLCGKTHTHFFFFFTIFYYLMHFEIVSFATK